MCGAAMQARPDAIKRKTRTHAAEVITSAYASRAQSISAARSTAYRMNETGCAGWSKAPCSSFSKLLPGLGSVACSYTANTQ
jgi:hypothetical protein